MAEHQIDGAGLGRRVRAAKCCVPAYALALMGLAALLLAACVPAGPAAAVGAARDAQTRKVSVEGGGSYTDVSPAGLATMLKQKDFPLIDVHVPYQGEIEGTDLFIPYDQIEASLDRLPKDRHARVVLYCRSGSMSATAARALVRLGYTDVWNLDGGMNAWKQAGYPLLDKGRQ